MILKTELKQQLKLSQGTIQKLELLSLPLLDMEAEIKKEEESNPFITVSSSKSAAEFYMPKIKSIPDDDGDEKSWWMERIIAEGENLYEHLEKQIAALDIDEDTKRVLLTLASALDDNGFFPSTASDYVKAEDRKYLCHALEILHSLDPVGIGAYSVPDSLSIQIKALEMNKEDEDNLIFIANNLEMIKNSRTDRIMKALDINEADAKSLIDIIKSLTPYPGEKFNQKWDNIVIPEIRIRKNRETKEIEITDYNDSLPEVSLNPEYQKMLADLEKDKKDKETLRFLEENKKKAEDLIDALNIRKTNSKRIAFYLLDKQKDFFQNGPSRLVPDTMTACAEALSLSLSTVSRIANGKAIETDWGLFPISYFFSSSSGFSKDDEAAISKNAIKEEIKKILEENKNSRLSDQKIADTLNEKGIKIARRTVAKYRNELNIETSYER